MALDIKMVINGLTIPDALSKAIASGEWMSLSSSPELTKLFDAAEIVQPIFYNKDALVRENAYWSQELDLMYLGKPNVDFPPGDIDPKNSLLVADLGPDRPIALDYRVPNEPRVIRLAEEVGVGWIEVAPNIEALIEVLSGEGRE